MRGYFGIGVERISKQLNLGNLMRSAHGFGASFAFTIGARYISEEALSDTSRASGHLPIYAFDKPADMVLPTGCALVGVELIEGAIDLPSIGKTSAPPAQPIEISIQDGGRLSLIDRDISSAERPVSRDELIKLIKSKQARKPDQPVVISADKNVRYEAVIEIMDLLQQNRVKRVGLLAKARGGSG